MLIMDPGAGIGNQLNLYHGMHLRRREIILIVAFLCLSLIPFFVGLYRTLYGYAQYGSVAAISWGVIWFSISIFFLFLIVGYGIYRLNISKLNITLHTAGICIKSPFKRKYYIRWDQVTELYVNQERTNSSTRNPDIHCIIRTSDKRLSLRTSQIENLLELITQIKSSVYIHLYPRICAKFRVGSVISFGPLEIQKKYISVKGRGFIPATTQIYWKDIGFITLKSGYLLLKLHNKKQYELRAAKIPNVEILFQLIEDRARG
jgi:hypothetical protein